MFKYFFSLFLLASICANAQKNDTTKYYKSYDYGMWSHRAKFDSIVVLPNGTVIDRSFVFPSRVDTSSLSNRINTKVSYGDTSTMLSNYRHWLYSYLKAADITGKINASDTATMLGHYYNSIGYGLSKTGQSIKADTSILFPAVRATIHLTPAGNYGNIQINRNGVLTTPGLDSLSYNNAGVLTVKGNRILLDNSTDGVYLDFGNIQAGVGGLYNYGDDSPISTYELSTGKFNYGNNSLMLNPTTGKDTLTGTLTITDSLKAGTIKRIGGTSSQFLKADGSVDASTYATTANLALKVNISDTATMLSHYFNQIGYGILNTGQALRVDSSTINTAMRSYVSGSYLPLAGGTLTGNLLFSTDNTKDIGASGATRPRTGYFGTSVKIANPPGSDFIISQGAVNTIRISAGSGPLDWDGAVLKLGQWGNDGLIRGPTAGSTNRAAQKMIIQSGTSSGNGAASGIDFYYSGIVGTSGSTESTPIKAWSINETGNFITGTDNIYDIGASGATRPRTGYFGTSIFNPLFIGGTGTTSTLTYKTTTGVGTTGADHIFQVGNNGATEAMRILNNGNVGIGTTSPNSTLHTNGSFATAYRAITALRTLNATDHTIEVTANTFNVTLPTAVGITGRQYIITNSGTGVTTIATTSAQTFVNVVATPTTLTLAQFSTVTVVSNGANWLRTTSL